MNELTESLDRAEPFPSGEEAYNRGEDCWIVDTIVVEAARKWAELEALVADGGRVAVETPCQHGRFEFHGPISDANHGPCLGNERRIILGEGAEQ